MEIGEERIANHCLEATPKGAPQAHVQHRAPGGGVGGVVASRASRVRSISVGACLLADVLKYFSRRRAACRRCGAGVV
jgi:hypothetical protein